MKIKNSRKSLPRNLCLKTLRDSLCLDEWSLFSLVRRVRVKQTKTARKNVARTPEGEKHAKKIEGVMVGVSRQIPKKKKHKCKRRWPRKRKFKLRKSEEKNSCRVNSTVGFKRTPWQPFYNAVFAVLVEFPFT